MASSKDSVNHTSTLLGFADTLYLATRGTNEAKSLDDITALSAQRNEIASLLSYHSAQLTQLNPAVFEYLSDSQKAQMKKQLLFTTYLFAAQYQIDEAEARTKNLGNSLAGINTCLKRLEELNFELNEPPVAEKNTSLESEEKLDPEKKKEKQLQKALAASEKHLKYLGLTILAPWLTTKILEFASMKESELSGATEGKKTTLAIEWMSAVNGRRLYWVWGGGMLASVLELLAFHKTLPTDQIEQAQKHLSTPSPVTGYMSWLLYYTRFGINLGLLLKHTIAGPWMSKEEAKIPAWERFKTQWAQRKFALLNDSIWATANMVCFFWLKGPGALGYAGNIVTAGLLLMDLALTIWGLVEESTKHNKEMEAFTKKQTEFKKKAALMEGLILGHQRALEVLKTEIEDFENNQKVKQLLGELLVYQKEKEQIDLELKHLKKLIKQSEMEWKYKKYGLVSNVAYAAGLLLAFSLFCCFFFPPAALAPALVIAIGVAGAALCFTLTILYAAVNGGLEIDKTKASIKEAREECQELMKLFTDTDDVNVKKQLYLQSKGLMAESKYQEEMVRFQAIKLVRSIFIDAFIPAIVFASLVFMPLGIGLGVMAAGLAIALISHIIINQFEPKHEKIEDLENFDRKEFDKEFAAFEKRFDDKFPEAKTKGFEATEKELVELFAQPKKEAKKERKPSCFGLFSNGYEKLSNTDEELNPRDMPSPMNSSN
ncbi:hypothetical protein [Legionella brunensis]|uniref:Coiled-coil protein n=1 Tax=Legionella brunensis TaxID=29422 RepID=A0A0W0SUJ4_9GAMM|nr:hypothetical protein [Legionella brunensis]KTC86932.1 hypothetical protein Lbru_0161 [Legionella brunensis]